MAQGEAAPEDDGKRSSTRQWQRYTSYLRRPSCLSSPAADGPTGVGSDRSSGSAAEQRAPAHLVVMVNGIIGSASHESEETSVGWPRCNISARAASTNRLSLFSCVLANQLRVVLLADPPPTLVVGPGPRRPDGT
ncbi:Putative serine esterase (DUF676) [Musa troglodytarum]|uniref:Serine esterase (DUF676) n=1 Tax=Musa troglodytarum TaxID=320322 RepID=A0A9E7JAC3_9LILI|nr:Putative serine esterase (DUF676) [Musa troglodytarum]